MQIIFCLLQRFVQCGSSSRSDLRAGCKLGAACIAAWQIIILTGSGGSSPPSPSASRRVIICCSCACGSRCVIVQCGRGEQHSEAACSGHSAQAALERTQLLIKTAARQQPSGQQRVPRRGVLRLSNHRLQSSRMYACVRVLIACSSRQNIVCVRLN